MMTGKQKIYFLIDAIVDAREITPSGQVLVIDPLNDLNQNYNDTELSLIFTKLAEDKKVLKLIKAPRRVKSVVDELDPYDVSDDGCWHIELLPAFDRYFLELQHEPEYIKFTGRSPVEANKPTTSFPKYEKKVLEKIWNILQEIEEKRQMGIEGASVRIPSYTGFGSDADQIYEARKTILEKLQSIEAIFNLHKVQTGALFFWAFDLTNKYVDVFEYYKNSYKELALSENVKKDPLPTEANDIAYKVGYSEITREISINNFLLAKPDFNRENEVVFTYLYQHPYERVSKLQLEKETGTRLLKGLPKIVENLGFTGDRKIFFEVTAEGILFRNPVKRKDLEELGIKVLKIK